MKKMKALSLLLAAALTVSSVAVNDITADAAKKPKLSKTKKTIYVGQKYKIKLKNGAKKAKVTWKASKSKKKTIVKIVKKNTKGKTAYVQIKGVKTGKSTVSASYKLGKSKAKTLKCKITVKKKTAKATATPSTVPVVPSTAPSAAPSTAPTEPAKTDAPDVTNTPKPSKTPKPTATVKPTAEPNADIDGKEVIDLMKLTHLEVNVNGNEKEIVITNNDDGSVTLDFTDTTWEGARWYFGTEKNAEGKYVNKPVNLTNFKYLVVEGDNQKGLAAGEDGVIKHGLNAQLLDGIDVNESNNNNPNEIGTQPGIAFPITFDFEKDGTDLSNILAFEIFSNGDDNSLKNKGPITVKSIKAYKDKATYDKLMEEATATNTPVPSDTPAPTPTNRPDDSTVNVDLSKAVKLGTNGTVKVENGVVTGTGVDGILIPMGQPVKANEMYDITISGQANAGFRTWISDDGGWTNISDHIINPASFDTAYTVTVTADNAKPAVQVKGFAGAPAFESFKITKVSVKKHVAIEAETVTVDGVEYNVNLDPSGTDVKLNAKADKFEYTDGILKVKNTDGVFGDLFEVKAPKDDCYKSVEIEFSDYAHSAGGAPDFYGICYKHIVAGADKNITTLPKDSNKLSVDFNGDAGNVEKIVFFSVGSKNSINIKSIKFVKSVAVEADKYVIPDFAGKVFIKGTASGIDVDEELDVVDYATLGEYAATYKDVYDSFTKMADKTSGELIKPVGDKDVVYTATEANKGTIAYNGKTTAVEFVKAEGSITAKFERQGHNFEATAVDGKDGIINIKKDGVEGYTVKVSGDEDAFTVEYTAVSGNILNLVYDGTSMSILTTADIDVSCVAK